MIAFCQRHLPAEVLEVILADVGVEVVYEEAQVVQPIQPRRHDDVAAGDAGEQLLDGEAGHATVGGVDVELGDGAGQGLDTPAAGQAPVSSAGSWGNVRAFMGSLLWVRLILETDFDIL